MNLFEDARLTRMIGAIAADTQVTLTGVLGSGTAQVKTPLVGWVQAAGLKPCGTATQPPALPTKGACRRLRSPDSDGSQYADLRNGLVAYNLPGRDPQRAGSEQDGPGKGATVYLLNPPQTAGKWVRVFYRGLAGNERLGWVSLGTGDCVNLTDCSSSSRGTDPLPAP